MYDIGKILEKGESYKNILSQLKDTYSGKSVNEVSKTKGK